MNTALIRNAVDILKTYGVNEVYIFGSQADNTATEKSDLDIAVKGLPDKIFYRAGGELMMKLNLSVDLIDLNDDNPFTRHLINSGELVRVN
ncbi:MAG: hypothetical protein A2X64_08930 [Ignavibacteria bacterium GWF2_33_9]|nr:MAG: hypothetical protein A2X64_08930 [Ignavibacteria bacterium GWF2_33_9]